MFQQKRHMHRYAVDQDFDTLEDWPFINPQSEYKILRGEPKASGRMDEGGAGQVTRLGVWRCTAGAFECTELGDELQSILTGRVRVTWLADGSTQEFGPGDSFYTRKGERVIWDVLEDVTKAFFSYKDDGF